MGPAYLQRRLKNAIVELIQNKLSHHVVLQGDNHADLKVFNF